MAKTASINIKIEPEFKQDLVDLYAKFGLTLTSAVKMFFNESLLSNGVPLMLNKPRYNEKTMKELKQIRKDKDNPEMWKSFDNLEDLFKDLYNDEED